MAEPAKFTATDNFEHRYAEPIVLRKALIELGFKDEDIKIRATEAKGLDVQLPREVTKEQKQFIYQKFVDAKYAKRAPPQILDDEDE
ncbi:hypothetical protein EKO27_g3650 [Xylaria grammica]|uniref:Uncharacterized protein n=1 Tax=Xylaria grammica TaxID=363999 RepID=A0A439DAL4_9PEZI|nr:hypothetical protein EKO27_g3650 [Xylaria grammica]